MLELVSRGDVAASSFAFKVTADDWDHSGGTTTRHLLSGLLIDTAPVTNPAYQDTSCALRSLAAFRGAAFEDVVTLAARGELRKLFTRTDRPPIQRRTMSGAQARAYLMGRRLGLPPRRNWSGAKARAYLLGKRWGLLPQSTRDPRQAKARLYRARIEQGW